MSAPSFDMLARIAATGVLNSLVEGTVIALGAWAFLRLRSKSDSRARFAVWFVALLLAVFLPWIGAPASNPTLESGHSTSVGITLPSWWASAIFWLWAAGASLALLRVGFAFWQLLRLRGRSRPLANDAIHVGPDAPSASSGQALVRAGERSSPRGRSSEIRLSDDVRIPTAVGFFKPLIVIPSWTLEELSPNELNSVLIHELEHLRRWDDWTNLAQKILTAVFFFHPAIWWLDRKLALEREMACDEAVLAQTGDRHAYAACLVRVAEKSRLRCGLALAQSVVGRVSQTTHRVTEILRAHRQPVTTVWKPALYLLSATSLCGVLLLSQTPLVSFRSELPSVAAVTPSTLAMGGETPALPRPHPILVRQPASHPVVRDSQLPPPKVAVVSDAARASATTPVLPDGAVQPAAFIDLTPVRGFVVVVESEQFGQFAPAFWTICVWQVDVHGWHRLIPETRAPAKSI